MLCLLTNLFKTKVVSSEKINISQYHCHLTLVLEFFTQQLYPGSPLPKVFEEIALCKLLVKVI